VKSQVAIDLGHRRLRAVEAVIDRGRATVVRCVDIALPAEVIDGTEAVRGAFIALALRNAGISADRAIWTIVRDRLSFKRLTLPGAERDEIAGMVRLAMLREAAVSADAVVDFVPIGAEAWAVAASAKEIASVRAVAAAADISVERIAPRTFGTAYLLETLPAIDARIDSGDAPDAAIDLCGDAVELVVAGRDGLRATRGATVVDPDADASVTEARRSWTGFRLQQPDQRPAAIDVIGSTDVAARVVVALAGDAGIPVAHLATHPDVTCTVDPGTTWPLVGLLLESARKRERIDLASPRRAPDLAARRRMQLYAVVSIIGIAYAIGWTIGRKERATIESRRTELRAKAEGALPEHRQFKRDELRARHIEAWTNADLPWLDSLAYIAGFAPDASRVVIAGWNGQALSDEATVSKDGTMKVPAEVRIAIDAEAADRATADALRESLVSKRDFNVRSTSTEGKAGRRLPVAVEMVIDSIDGPPVQRPASAAVSSRRGVR
jgi:hypothetical protein